MTCCKSCLFGEVAGVRCMAEGCAIWRKKEMWNLMGRICLLKLHVWKCSGHSVGPSCHIHWPGMWLSSHARKESPKGGGSGGAAAAYCMNCISVYFSYWGATDNTKLSSIYFCYSYPVYNQVIFFFLEDWT